MLNWIKNLFTSKYFYPTVKKGHKVFEFNTQTKDFNSVSVTDGKIEKKQFCIYVSALNKKNAAKKILKWLN